MSLSENLIDLKEAAEGKDGLIHKAEAMGEELILWTHPSTVVALAQFLKLDAVSQCSQLMDITAIDYPGQSPRFVVAYQFLSLTLNRGDWPG